MKPNAWTSKRQDSSSVHSLRDVLDDIKTEIKCTRTLEPFSADTRLLFDLRRYLKIMVALHCVFVGVVVIAFGVLWSALTQYDILKKESVNSLNGNIQGTVENANTLSTLAVPIIANLQYLTNAVVAGVFAQLNSSFVNSTAVAARATGVSVTGARHLLESPEEPDFVIDQQDLMQQDFKMRKMVYKNARALLQSLDTQVTSFNVSSVSDVLSWVVHGINYGTIYNAFDRTMSDIEAASKFGVLASAMLGLAAQVTNTTMPSASDLFVAYGVQASAASAARGSGGCET